MTRAGELRVGRGRAWPAGDIPLGLAPWSSVVATYPLALGLLLHRTQHVWVALREPFLHLWLLQLLLHCWGWQRGASEPAGCGPGVLLTRAVLCLPRYTMVAQELVVRSRGVLKERGWRLPNDRLGSGDDISVFVIPLGGPGNYT